MIKEENAVRTRRRKLGLSRKANLRVEGQPKKAVTAFLRCVVESLPSPRFRAAWALVRARGCFNGRCRRECKLTRLLARSFATDVRARGIDSDVLQGETSILEQSKLIAQAWRALSDDEKKVRLSLSLSLCFRSGCASCPTAAGRRGDRAQADFSSSSSRARRPTSTRTRPTRSAT